MEFRTNEKLNKAVSLTEKLFSGQKLSEDDFFLLIDSQCGELSSLAADLADRKRKEIYGTDIYIRGLIEIGNYCRNDCFYCGIRKSCVNCERFRLSQEEILSCCDEGYSLGFRTFVLQGGEGIYGTDDICRIITDIRGRFRDCAITLSLGEYPYEDYKRMFDAGANRYLLRHETADREHYSRLHPPGMSFDNRMRCLYDLKEIGFQVGCGFMVGSPFQSSRSLAKDLAFISDFSPDMCGIGPFIPAKGTPFENEKPGTAEQTTYLLSLLRLIKPNLLLPSTTALGTIRPDGRELGILAGANVIMPNLSPLAVRSKYTLYDNKLFSAEESAQYLSGLKARMENIGFRIVTSRGDIKK